MLYFPLAQNINNFANLKNLSLNTVVATKEIWIRQVQYRFSKNNYE